MISKQIKPKFKINFKTNTNFWHHVNLIPTTNWKTNKNNPLQYKLKKKKWQNKFFFNSLSIKKKRISNKIKFKFNKPIKSAPLKFIYKNNLHKKQQLKVFYGNLLNYQLLNILTKIKKKNKFNIDYKFISKIESRLDITLFRVFFFNKLINIQKLIRNGNILVNNKIIKNKQYYLLENDIVSFNLSKHKKIKVLQEFLTDFSNKIKQKVTVLPIKHIYFHENLEVNYKTLKFIYLTEPKPESLFFPMRSNFKFINKLFKI
jgi:ribosomal protein S4